MKPGWFINQIETKCPFCGAEPKIEWDVFDYPADFVCGTLMEGKHKKPQRGSDCYECQIADLQRRLELWREAKCCINFTWEMGGIYWNAVAQDVLDKLKAAGEIE